MNFMKPLQRVLLSTKVWVALLAVVSSVLVVLGADPAKWTPLLSSINGLAVAVIAGVAIEDAAEKSASADPAASTASASVTVPPPAAAPPPASTTHSTPS